MNTMCQISWQTMLDESLYDHLQHYQRVYQLSYLIWNDIYPIPKRMFLTLVGRTD